METPAWLLLVKTLAWPFVVIVIICIFFIIFRRSIAALLGRTSEIGRKGLKTIPEQSQKLADTSETPTEELMNSFDNAILKERETAICTDLETRGITASDDKVRVLIRHLAASQLFFGYELVDNVIWGSQIYILENLNVNRQGVLKKELKTFYDEAEKNWPLAFSVYPYDAYLSFLKSLGVIIIKENERLLITNYGVEFLGYLTKTGRSNARLRPG